MTQIIADGWLVGKLGRGGFDGFIKICPGYAPHVHRLYTKNGREKIIGKLVGWQVSEVWGKEYEVRRHRQCFPGMWVFGSSVYGDGVVE
jgi:hypothetical protein